jgi:hypothetical protein
VVLATLGAPERRRLRGRRRRDAEPDPPPPAVTTGRATVVEAEAPLAGEDAARAHLRRAGEAEAEAAVRTLNRLLAAQRLAVRDPYLHDVGLGQAIAIRVGYATGQGGAEGRLAETLELPVADAGPARVRRRASALRPQEHLAAIVGGRTPALVAEELALRARADVEAGRTAAAALELRSALEAAVAELAGEDLGGDLPARVEELRALVPEAKEAARVALRAGAEPDEVERILGRLEAALRARAIHLP